MTEECPNCGQKCSDKGVITSTTSLEEVAGATSHSLGARYARVCFHPEDSAVAAQEVSQNIRVYFHRRYNLRDDEGAVPF